MTEQRKVLVVYYSRTNTTRQLAEAIHEHAGGDIVEITPEVPYSAWFLVAVAAATKEKIMNTLRPITTHVDNIEQYDAIFIGTPIWCSTAAPPVKTFVHSHTLDGKKTFPFCVYGGSGECSAYEDLKKLAPNAVFGDGFGTRQADVDKCGDQLKEWVDRSLSGL